MKMISTLIKIGSRKKKLYLKISSAKFKEIIFDKNGKLAKYLLDHIKKVIISEDYEEMER